MNRAIQQFKVNLQSAQHLGVIYLAFSDKVTEAIPLDELLRAEMVLAVSALDCYVHDLVRIGMARAFAAMADEPNAFLNFGVSLGFVKSLRTCTSEIDTLALVDQEIRRLNAFKTFQSADSISQSLSLIGINGIWDKVGGAIGATSADTRTRLNIIVDRRNRIAHEGDIDPTMGIGIKYPIDVTMVQSAIGFIDAVVHSIQGIVEREIAF